MQPRTGASANHESRLQRSCSTDLRYCRNADIAGTVSTTGGRNGRGARNDDCAKGGLPWSYSPLKGLGRGRPCLGTDYKRGSWRLSPLRQMAFTRPRATPLPASSPTWPAMARNSAGRVSEAGGQADEPDSAYSYRIGSGRCAAGQRWRRVLCPHRPFAGVRCICRDGGGGVTGVRGCAALSAQGSQRGAQCHPATSTDQKEQEPYAG